MFFDNIQNILLAKRKKREYGYTAVGELLRNVHGTEAKIVDVIFTQGGSIIKFAFDDDFTYYTTIKKLQDRYFRMVEFSQGRMTMDQYDNANTLDEGVDIKLVP